MRTVRTLPYPPYPRTALALYDATNFSKGPFETTPLPLLAATVSPSGGNGGGPRYPPTVSWTAVEFSPDDRFIALATADRGILVVDAYFPNRELALLADHPLDPARPSTISFSPCGRFLATGGADGHVYTCVASGGACGLQPGRHARTVVTPHPLMSCPAAHTHSVCARRYDLGGDDAAAVFGSGAGRIELGKLMADGQRE